MTTVEILWIIAMFFGGVAIGSVAVAVYLLTNW